MNRDELLKRAAEVFSPDFFDVAPNLSDAEIERLISETEAARKEWKPVMPASRS